MFQTRSGCLFHLSRGVLAKFGDIILVKDIILASLAGIFVWEGKVKQMQYFKQMLQKEWQLCRAQC